MQEIVRSLRWKGESFIISAVTGEGCKELTYADYDASGARGGG